MQTLRKKTSPCKYKNEPSRFLGEGVSFKAKLIGILEVNEARGDRMCQEALADLKMAIRAAGEHKQRISINIAIDGLRLRDEKNGDCLYHHPVHKISFIAQDMSDSRAFGYIFGSPDTGHRFFGIKTDKAASQVVIAMRDLFQVVFELKKKEIEMAKQHIEQHQIKISGGIFGDSGTNITKNGVNSSDQSVTRTRTNSDTLGKSSEQGSSSKSAHQTSEVIADLLDLEFELNSIQQGINQMERITPSDPFGPTNVKEDAFHTDPFGDSFTPAATLPPPPRAIKPPPKDPFDPPSRQPNRRGAVRAKERKQQASSPVPVVSDKEKHWFDRETESIFGEDELVTPPFTTSTNSTVFPSMAEQVGNELSKTPPQHSLSEQFDVFTDLDPLGTGRSKPYIDRKDFFQELKNPPKKVLKDLVSEAPAEGNAPLFQATFDAGSILNETTGDVSCNTSKDSVPFNSSLDCNFPTNSMLNVDPFEDGDPFFKTDPFADGESLPFPSANNSADPFDTEFADFTMFGGRRTGFPITSNGTAESAESKSAFHAPLRVSLPPERSSVESELDRESGVRSSKPRGRARGHKHTGLAKPPSSRRMTRQSVPDAAPEPPPRPASVEPPPLPPKRQQPGVIARPPPRPPHHDDPSHYDYIETASSPPPTSPPVPVPARRPRFGPDAPQRPQRHRPPHVEDDYLTPTPFPLLPPPHKKTQSRSPTAVTDLASLPVAPAPPAPPPPRPAASLNITLSQLTETGFTDLATALNMSPTQLSDMTLQDLTACLAKHSARNKTAAESQPEEPEPEPAKKDKRDKYSTLRESVDEEPTFKSDFENNFQDFEVNEKGTEDVFQDTLFDKYAVFRELIDEEKTEKDSDLIEDPIECEPQSDESQTELKEKEIEATTESMQETEDRYAALRDISIEERCPDDEDDYDLLTLSRQPSESTESPTMETATMREPQSIMETTIYEEDVSALEADNDENFEEVPDIVEDVEEVSKDFPACVVSEADNETETAQAETSNRSSSSEKEETKDNFVDCRDKEEIDSTSEGWAKFDGGTFNLDKSIVMEHEEINTPGQVLDDVKESGSDNVYGLAKVNRAWGEQKDIEMSSPSFNGTEKSKLRSTYKDKRDRSEMGMPSLNSDGKESTRGRTRYTEKSAPEGQEGRGTRSSPYSTDGRESVKSRGLYIDKLTPDEREGSDLGTSPLNSEDREFGKVRGRYSEKPTPEGREGSEIGASPHSSDGRDSVKTRSHYDEERRRRHRREVEPEDGRENGWSEEDMPVRRDRVYREDKRGRRRRVSPWERGRRSEEEEWRFRDADEDDEYESYWSTRPRHRGPSWEEERRRRFEPDDREDVRKRRLSPWGGDGDRRRSRESVSWDEDEGFARRPREREWRREQSWARPRREPREPRVRYHRDRSRESPWEDEYSEPGDEDRSWSARRCVDKSPGEFENGPALPAATRRNKDSWSRPPSRDEYFNSDQEYDYWPQPDRTYDQRSQTLHSRRSKFKKTQDHRSYSQRSPFEDDFTSSFGPEFKNHEGESDASDIVRKKSPVEQPHVDSFPRRREEVTSPPEDTWRPRSGRGSCNRQSPFEDDFAPPRLGSSVSSDVSDHRKSPRGPVGPETDDVFVAGDFETDVPVKRPDRRVGWSGEESKKSLSATKSRLSSLRTDPSIIKKSESVNIFRRENDPFDDDFFSQEAQPTTGVSRPRPDRLRTSDKSNNNDGDPFKWTKAFESFNFDDEQ